MIMGDSWLLCLGTRGDNAGLQCDFYEELAKELVLNDYYSVGLRRLARFLGSVAT
jgi:hypothetical protein